MPSVPTPPVPPTSSVTSPVLFIDDYEAVRRSAYARVEALGLKRRWIARQIGRSVRCVSEVLRGTDTGAPTLALVVSLLDDIEAGRLDAPPTAFRSSYRTAR